MCVCVCGEGGGEVWWGSGDETRGDGICLPGLNCLTSTNASLVLLKMRTAMLQKLDHGNLLRIVTIV